MKDARHKSLVGHAVFDGYGLELLKILLGFLRFRHGLLHPLQARFLPLIYVAGNFVKYTAAGDVVWTNTKSWGSSSGSMYRVPVLDSGRGFLIGNSDLYAVDLASGKTTTIGVGNAPRKIVVQPMMGDPKVSISDFKFVPRVLTIAPGETVTWSNDDGAPHAIAFKGGAAGSDTLFAGKTFSRTFDKAGSYDYYCGIHNYMTGQIIVSPK